MAATWGMARRPRTDRQQKLQEAQAALKGERAVLKQQQARVAAARRELDELSRCDACGVRVLPCGGEEQLCFSCFRQRREQARLELLARSGYGPDGRRLIAA
jgi:multidrug efflux pump subunit AcrA (membrane-fusion protein)